ncbi:MAG: response regulator [Candidatus Anammoxibacter sp.]
MNKKVLIIDDEAHIRLLLKRSLRRIEDSGVKILLAEDGKEGVEMAKKERPDLVFLDICLPKLNGFEVFETIRHDLRLQNTYIIFLTAKGQEFEKEIGARVGADGYITKPFDTDAIAAIAGKSLGIKV